MNYEKWNKDRPGKTPGFFFCPLSTERADTKLALVSAIRDLVWAGETPRRPVGIVVGIQLVSVVVVLTTVIVVNLVFPIIGALVMTAGLPVGVVIRIHLIGAVGVIAGHGASPRCEVQEWFPLNVNNAKNGTATDRMVHQTKIL